MTLCARGGCTAPADGKYCSKRCSAIARLWILAYPSGERITADDTVCAGLSQFDRCAWWQTEPALGRVADGVPGWMVGALGDAIVPQIAEWIFRRIQEAEAEHVA